jgi:SEC-C motif.
MNQEKLECSNEQMAALFELFKDLPTPSLGRNDPCICGSGLKYKKCCLEKDKNCTAPVTSLKSFEIKMDALTPEESGNKFPALLPEDQKLMTILYHDLQEYPDTVDSEDCEYFQILNALHIKYPDNPIILNYITGGCNHLGQKDQVEELIAKTYEKFPNYLFAQTAQASIYLENGFPEKAFEVLKGAHTLKQLFPSRTVFHISEVKAFELFMIRYFCETEKLKQADTHLQFLQEVLEEDDPLLQDAQEIFESSKTLFNLKINMLRLHRLAKKWPYSLAREKFRSHF